MKVAVLELGGMLHQGSVPLLYGGSMEGTWPALWGSVKVDAAFSRQRLM